MKLPAIAYLPAKATLTPDEVRKAVGGLSRAGLMYRRKHCGFPSYYGRNNAAVYDTKQVAEWLTANGTDVRWL